MTVHESSFGTDRNGLDHNLKIKINSQNYLKIKLKITLS